MDQPQPVFTHLALHVADLDASIAFYRAYCGLVVVHERLDSAGGRVVWLAEPGRQAVLIFVLIGGGPARVRRADDYGHLGFACHSRAEVDEIARQAQADGRLVWPPRQEPFPVGYYCGVVDPDGTMVEFSFGQPLGPGAETSSPIALIL